ncbi:NUDIX domain-containing protein [Streptomyces sp. NBC_01431]|uniref:NUDIX domain-containing protein n=1 Tax=Streptomyces sp. NBC_01431 TaxID=2903863 RepID=UPI002E2FA49A|nr:NUDIX domain-containing protein [Streptomyces sp. NBC_01431]
MTGKRSAGILVYRHAGDGVEVLVGHMGGPFFAGRDAGAWSVPKGEYGPDEEPEAAARREFQEELGLPAPEGALVPLGEIQQRGGKTVTVWALEGDLDPAEAVPGVFTMEWPRGSGALREFPEMDRFAWLSPAAAAPLLVKGQELFLERLVTYVTGGGQCDGRGC